MRRDRAKGTGLHGSFILLRDHSGRCCSVRSSQRLLSQPNPRSARSQKDQNCPEKPPFPAAPWARPCRQPNDDHRGHENDKDESQQFERMH